MWMKIKNNAIKLNITQGRFAAFYTISFISIKKWQPNDTHYTMSFICDMQLLNISR
jgi:hypothetical protein